MSDPIMAPLDVINVPEGRITLSLPAKLSPDSMQEIEVWLGLVIRRLRRTIDGRDVMDIPGTLTQQRQSAGLAAQITQQPANPDPAQPKSGQSAPALDPRIYPSAPPKGSSS